MAFWRILLRSFGGFGVKGVAESAWSYIDMIGKVDLREQGSYYLRVSGGVALYVDSPPSQQGGYFNRE